MFAIALNPRVESWCSCVWTETYEAFLIWARPDCPDGSPNTCSDRRCLPWDRFIICNFLYAGVVLLLVVISRGVVSPNWGIVICTSLGHVGWYVTVIACSVCLIPETGQRFVNRTVGEAEGVTVVSAMAVWVITLCCSGAGWYCEEPFNPEVKNKRKKKRRKKKREEKRGEDDRPCCLWLRRSVAGLSLQGPGFDHGSLYVKFLVDKLGLVRGLLRVLRFSPVSVIPSMLHTQLLGC